MQSRWQPTVLQEDVRFEHYRHHRHHRRKRRRKVLLIAALLLLLCGIVLSVIGYPLLDNRYHQDIALAYTGAKELQDGITLLRTLPRDFFNESAVEGARQDFGEALAILSRLNGDANLIPGMLAASPGFGSRVGAAKHLLPLALDASQAGYAGCSIISTLLSRLHNPLSKGAWLTASDLPGLEQNFQTVTTALAQAAGQVSQVQPQDLQFDPGLGKMLGEFRTALPAIQQGVEQAAALFSVLPQVLGIGTPAHYLVEIMDSTELRPGGGFIGNYGILTLTGGQIASAQVTDTYIPDKLYQRTHTHVPLPAVYAWFPFSGGTGWELRDSNLSADFPTSARAGEMLYNLEVGTYPLAGMIAITPQLIEQILTLTGPIVVPAYHETVTAQNLVDRIHYHQLTDSPGIQGVPSADGNSSVRKRFTALLAQAVLARVRELPAALLPRLFGILIDSLHTKDLQIYFNAAAAEKVLQFYHVDDSIQSPPGDGIFLVDANTAQTKINGYLVTMINDNVTIDQAGTAMHHTVITLTWTNPGLTARDFYGTTHYRAHLQVYVPNGSVLRAHGGWNPYDTGIGFERRYWAGNYYLDYPQTGTITLDWSIAGAAQHNGSAWQYSYLMQRQAGAQEKVSVEVALPACASVLRTSAGVVEDGKRQVRFVQVLSEDMGMDVDYRC
jgi:hypothetical protein